MRQKGFTLIELMVVIGIAALLGTVGIAGFNNYNNVQLLQTSANDVAAMLNVAKSRAQSQIKPSVCDSSEEEQNELNEYAVRVNIDNYVLFVRCNGGDIVPPGLETKTLPNGVKFRLGGTTIRFPTLTGRPDGFYSIELYGAGGVKFIKVDSLGGISVSNQ